MNHLIKYAREELERYIYENDIDLTEKEVVQYTFELEEKLENEIDIFIKEMVEQQQ